MFLSMRVAAARDEVFFFHRRHVWMPVTCHGMSNCRFWCMCSPKNGCVRSSVHSGHDLVEIFDIIVNNVCQEILPRHGDGAFLPIRVAAVQSSIIVFVDAHSRRHVQPVSAADYFELQGFDQHGRPALMVRFVVRKS